MNTRGYYTGMSSIHSTTAVEHDESLFSQSATNDCRNLVVPLCCSYFHILGQLDLNRPLVPLHIDIHTDGPCVCVCVCF